MMAADSTDRVEHTADGGEKSSNVLNLFKNSLEVAGGETVLLATPGLTARLIVYNVDTASLFEGVRDLVYPSVDANIGQPKIREGWRTYNFEVEDFHTYIAGGLRVHNTSIIDLIPSEAKGIMLSGMEAGGKYTVAKYMLENGVEETIRGRDLNGDTNTDLVERTTVVPGFERLGVDSRITWTELYNGDNSKPYDTKITGIEYSRGVIQGEEIGRTLGSALGSAISGGSIFAQVGSATIAATLLQNVGEFLHKNIDFNIIERQGAPVTPLEAAVNDTFKDLNRDLGDNLKIQVNSVLSGVVIGEIADALNLNGFGRGVFTTAGNTITTQFLTNVTNAITGTNTPSTVVSANLNLLEGFNYSSMVGNVVNSLGGYFGTQLGTLAVAPKNPQSALFGSAAAAVGSYVGGAALSVIPVIGTLIGSFAGQALGNLVGNALFDDDRVAYYSIFADGNGQVQYGYPLTQDGASLVLSQYMASKIADSVNSIYGNVDARIDPDHAFTNFTAGWYVNNQNEKIMQAVNSTYQAPYNVNEAQGIITSAVNYAVANSEMSGSDLILRRAYEASRDKGLVQLGFDLQVAKDYHKYLDNTQAINTIISDAPESAFAAGWVGTLQRAQELGLNKFSGFDGLEYLASNRDLIGPIGYNKADAERHYIKYGINEGRRDNFDAYQYLAANPSLSQSLGGINRDTATIHYMQYGYSEGKQTIFDHVQYLAANPGLAQALGGINNESAARHYINHGHSEGRSISFDAYSYLASHSNVAEKVGMDRYAAELSVIRDGFKGITFSASGYMELNPDVRAAFGGNLDAAAQHYAQTGRYDGFHRGIFNARAAGYTVEGGSGIDTVSYASTGIGIIIDLSAQQTSNGSGGDFLVSIENAVGTNANDTIVAIARTNRLEGLGGDDVLIAASNGATLDGGSGIDTVSYDRASIGLIIDLNAQQSSNGSRGDLFVSIESAVGSNVNDALVAGLGTRRLEGRGGDDLLIAAANGATLDGGSGTDTVSYERSSIGVAIDLNAQQTSNGSGGDFLISIENAVGSNANDSITAGSGTVRLEGKGGNDLIIGNGSNNILLGDAGADTVRGGGGSDTIYGGSGQADPNDGADQLYGDGGDDVIFGNSGDDIIYGGVGLSDPNDGADTVYAGVGNDIVYGNGGNDTLHGNGGSDTVHGGGGSDTIYGGDGQGDPFDVGDVLYGDEGDDFIFGNGGDDTIYGGRGTADPTDGSDNIYGGGGNDIIFGNAGADRISGDGGDDAFYGGGGNDILSGGTGADRFYFSPNDGRDTITDFNVYEGDRLYIQGQGYTAAAVGAGTELALSGGGVVALSSVTLQEFQTHQGSFFA